MVSRPDDGAGAVGPMTVPFLLEAHFRGGTLVVRPVGELTPKTYERLRDYLLQCAAEEPVAIVVDLASMRVTIASLLTVFPPCVTESATGPECRSRWPRRENRCAPCLTSVPCGGSSRPTTVSATPSMASTLHPNPTGARYNCPAKRLAPG